MVIVDPKSSLAPDPDYYGRVSKVHEHGGYGSVGYRAPWSHEESRKLLLRTHTTASSAQMLYKLAAECRGEVPKENPISSKPSVADQKGDGFRPAKFFSIDRVFRNETMDATHLAEFHQVEGVVADRNLTLADLIGNLLLLMIVVPSSPPSRFHASFLRKNGNQGCSLQACIQSIYRGARKQESRIKVDIDQLLAIIRDFCLPSAVE
jgi:hypothetical protein